MVSYGFLRVGGQTIRECNSNGRQMIELIRQRTYLALVRPFCARTFFAQLFNGQNNGQNHD